MISISVIKQSAKKATKYYMSEEKNYYLAENGIEQGREWYGVGAEKNGILGKVVEQDELEHFLSGKTYDGEVQKSFSGELRRGWDFTLSAPKSVSILALVYGDKELLKAHDAAVKHTLSQIEKDAAQVRIFDKASKQMVFQNTGNIIAAMIRHSTSREMDPQLHTHNLICNMSYDHLGRVRAMASSKEQGGDVVHGMAERVYRDQKYYTAIYQSSLAKLAFELGYKVKSVGNGQFEIEGIPESVILEFSQRREQILDQAKAFGVTTAKGMDVATQMTRKDKVFATIDELKAHWLSRHEPIDINALKNKDIINLQQSHSSNANKTIDLALSHLSRFHTKITYEKLMETALGEFAISDGVDYMQCQQAVDHKIQSGELIPLNKNKSAFTTQKLLEKENSLISLASTKFHHLGVEANSEALNQLQLTSDNRNKLTDILQSSKQVILVNVKGSQKQIVEGLLHASENSGLKVAVLSPNRAEKNELAKMAQRQSSTLSQWIKNKFKEDCHDTVNHYLNNDTGSKNIIIVDSANRLGVDECNLLLKKTQETHTKIIFLNHDKMKANRFGNSIETLKQADVFELNWQNNRTGPSSVDIHAINDDKERFQKVIDDYVALPEQVRLKTQIIALTKKELSNLNAHIRETLKNQGEIGRLECSFDNLNPVFLTDEEKQITKNYRTGMIIKFFDSNDRKQSYHFLKSSRVESFRISAVNTRDGKIILNNDHGKTHAFMVSELAKKQFMLFHSEKMQIATGDILRSMVDINRFGIQAGERIAIKSSGIFGLQLQKMDGTIVRVHKRELDGKSFQYDYAKPISAASNDMDRTLLLTKSYAANEKVLNTLLDKTINSVEIYTEDEQKIKLKLAQNHVQPTVINTIIDAAEKIDAIDSIEKFVSDKTSVLLKSDLMSALTKINIACNQTIVDKSVEFALSKISEREAAFRHQDLVKEALCHAIAEEKLPLNKDEVEEKLSQLKNSGQLLSQDYEDGTRWTTKESLTLEKNILNLICDGKKQVEPLAPKAFVQKSLESTTLTPSQQEAVFLITTTQDRFIAIQGLPGTGKSTMLLNVLNIVTESKKLSGDKVEFVGLAPTWQAVNELKDKGVKAQTIASFLQEIKSDSFDKEKYKNTVFLLDEASMVSNKDKAIFLSAINFSNARAVDVGDIEQLQGQGAGKSFELAIRRGVVECVYLTDIIRQNPSPLLKFAVENVIDKNVKQSFLSIEHQHKFECFGEKINKSDFKSLLNVKNIIETYQALTDDPKLNKEAAKKQILVEGANEYLNRTPESRKNSIFIAYSNAERDEFSEMIRYGLKKQSVLHEPSEIAMDRLRSLNLTRAEMRTIDAYILKNDSDKREKEKLLLSIGKENYFEIDSVDTNSKLVTLKNVKTNEIKIFNPSQHDHRNTCLWSKTTKPLAIGDAVVLRRADNARGHFSNVEYTVKSTDKESKTISLQNHDSQLTLHTSDLKDCHWDYAYSKTTDMGQGTTKKFVVSMVYSESMLTDVRRAIVDVSRATTHALLITDRKDELIKRLEGKTLQSIANNHGDKRSALDTIEKVIHTPVRYFDHANDASKINHNLHNENKSAIDIDLIKKYRHSVDGHLPLDRLDHTAKPVSEFKFDAQKYDALALHFNKSSEVNKIIDGVRAIEQDRLKSAVPRQKSTGEIELEI